MKLFILTFIWLLTASEVIAAAKKLPGCDKDPCKVKEKSGKYKLKIGAKCSATCDGKLTRGGTCENVQGNHLCCFGLCG
ncbi:Avr2 [Fulvia fulva]|uniref:AVR2 n=1 Tax=Passalora fulva TaxID=5499 RepID=Q8NID8_PASFU|nr:Avr2 [Fulvia fulva]AGD98923.1 AVR2 protein [Fulvia fulva]AIZ11401.1 AVR2 [Fulvia fulva]AIZ11402.1 AVR2 [Fulvia fulva]AJF35002.1 AVR2 protein [Fulvia fulva]KAK4615394.1 hypothetical protein CLAFUR4_09795 [Fulvia fulva]